MDMQVIRAIVENLRTAYFSRLTYSELRGDWAWVNIYSLTQLNDVKLNPVSKISPLAGT